MKPTRERRDEQGPSPTGWARRWRGLAAGLAVAVVAAGGAPAALGAPPRPVRTATCSNEFLAGDARLGPAQLPTVGGLAPLVAGYHQLAGLTPQQFIDRYWDPLANGWRFPPDNGFLLNAEGQPIEHVASVVAGEEIDRFGSEFGAFLAPFDTPYAERSLPPMSLDNFDVAYTCNYHVYRVVRTFSAEEGPIAPAFGQTGHGLQFQLVGTLVPGAPTRLNVSWLIDNGYLQRAN